MESHKLSYPQPNTEQEEKILEILEAKIETDEDYQKLSELVENELA